MNIRDRQILSLALPSIVSNITVPLLGMVDVAIVGHLGDAAYIGAISVGSMIFNIIYWLFGFLRMGTSGMTSQALGRRDLREVMRLLLRSATIGLSVAVVILLLQYPIRQLAFWLISPEQEVQALASVYFNICVWGAPAMLVLYGLTGWYIGMQNTRFPMIISIVQNVVNILASFVLVFVLRLEMRGVAIGTVIAQYTGLLLSLFLLFTYYGKLRKHIKAKGLFEWDRMLIFFKVNTDIFLRTLCLVAVNLYFLSAGARQGAVLLAVNTLLMQLYILFSYVMDGFAFAGEALCGKSYGASNIALFQSTVRRLFLWGVIMATSFTLLYSIGGQPFLSLLTDDRDVVSAASDYFIWAVLIPFAGMAAFIWDGVYIGITATRKMLWSSVLSSILFFGLWMAFSSRWGNHALWLAFILYLIARGLLQSWYYCNKKL